jgi:DNA-directed RNA polymerase subunit RPC12/RpoP
VTDRDEDFSDQGPDEEDLRLAEQADELLNCPHCGKPFLEEWPPCSGCGEDVQLKVWQGRPRRRWAWILAFLAGGSYWMSQGPAILSGRVFGGDRGNGELVVETEEDLLDEGPDEEDLRLAEQADELLNCPHCGARIHEESPRCPYCGDYVELEICREGSSWRWLWTLAGLLAAAALLYWLLKG